MYLVVRLKDIPEYCGEKISPSNLENVVLRKVAGVAEICVFGTVDGRGSDLATTVVVRKQTKAGAAMQAEEIENAVAENFRDAKNYISRLHIFSLKNKTKCSTNIIDHIPIVSEGVDF